MVGLREKLVYNFLLGESREYSSFSTRVVSMRCGGKLSHYFHPAARKLNKAAQGWARGHSELYLSHHHHLVSGRLNKAVRVRAN